MIAIIQITFKDDFAPCCYIKDINFCQTFATIESIAADGGNAVGDGDGGKPAAIRESITADGCHAVADGDGGQAAAFIESITADGGHAVGNGNGG